MKIKNIKINGFGKLEDKSLDLNNGINIIYGKNESGKSTLLRYITSMFYGLSKNKNGGTIPEVEKYEPWNTQEFSGKISYELDNKKTFEVYRDFKKKNPKIFNENFEDISKEFNIDKTKGNEFFYEQTGLEEEIFISSIITKQAEVKLDEKAQNTLIQKISNIINTGEDNTSYSSIINKLKKKINDEIGTQNTKERPINIIENKINELEKESQNIEEYNLYKFEIEDKINNINQEVLRRKEELDKLENVNIQKERLKESENKIQINKQILNNLELDLNKIIEEKKSYKVEEKNIPNKKIIVLVILIVLSVLGITFIPNLITKFILPSISLIYIITILIKYNNHKKTNRTVKAKNKELDERLKILEENKKRQEDELLNLEKQYSEEILKIKTEYNINNIEDIIKQIRDKQSIINDKLVTLHTLEIDKNNIIDKLEKLINIKEELDTLKEEKIILEEKRENIKRTIQYLEIAYNKMKEQITPKFTEELSNVMNKISNGKYNNVRINTNGQVIVEEKNGEYITVENLSIGTIDQLYLSLRLATIKEITKENMPIILDEAFAYYDDERLENILNYLANEYGEKQVIIFTCTDREKQSLEKKQIKLNLIQL